MIYDEEISETMQEFVEDDNQLIDDSDYTDNEKAQTASGTADEENSDDVQVSESLSDDSGNESVPALSTAVKSPRPTAIPVSTKPQMILLTVKKPLNLAVF
ncbi:MAG: hypothetical protein NXI00_24730 [Cytophagales bacterium]|nr:hypothetical protein [Cytophagales bacterium]